MPRKLRVQYRTVESFRQEYAQNIAKGGLFIPTRHEIEMREHVEVELVLAFADRSVILPGEVVHSIPPEMASAGAQPGVAIQFLVDGDELRGKLEGLSGPVATHVDERQLGTGRRVAPRSRAHVPADLEFGGEWLEGHTRNVSTSGVLVALGHAPPPVGRRVKVRIQLPSGGDHMKVPGQIARHVDATGVSCVGVHFLVPEARVSDVAAFMARVRAVEHARRLGGINGPIADLGIESVLAMFGRTAPEGMLTLSRGDEEGYIVIDHGTLRAQVGLVSGREALDELLSWNEGSFSFEGQADETLVVGDAIPVSVLAGVEPPAAGPETGPDGGLGDAEAADDELVLMDLDALEAPQEPQPVGEGRLEVDETDGEAAESEEERGGDADGFVADDDHSLGDFVLDDEEAEALESQIDSGPRELDPEATLVATGKGDRSGLGKTEEALLDLAAVGMTVAKAFEIIPEDEDEVRAALHDLLDEGFLLLA